MLRVMPDEPKPRGRPRRGYHHGDLRNALISAARRLIAERGPTGFVMADAARAADVAPSAPYRHFPSREALLAAVIEEGFRDLAARLRAARLDRNLTPLRALDAVCGAYLAAARDEPATFVAMFDRQLAPPPHLRRQEDADAPDERAAETLAFEELAMAVDAVIRTAPADARPPTLMVAHHIWMLCHGAAVLFADGGRPAPADADALLETAVGVHLRGLGLLPG